MTPRPGDGIDLDTLVADALNHADPNRTVDCLPYSSPISLLVIVAIARRLDLVEVMLEAGARMNAIDLAHVIWWWSSSEMVSLLLKAGTPHNLDCMRAAIRHGKWDVVFLLLDYGADLHTKYADAVGYTSIGMSLLHAGVWQNESSVVRQILERGMEVDERDSDEFTALMKACHYHKPKQGCGVETVYWLLKYGANPNVSTSRGETPLLLCLGERLDGTYYDHRIHIAQMLLKYGANPNAVSPRGTTPLMFAARDNCPILVKALLQAGAAPGFKTSDGKTALDVAVKWRSKDAEVLLRTYQ